MKFDRALVTGGAGFIGSHLCDQLLERGLTTRAFDNLSMGRREHLSPEVELIEGDVQDGDALRRAMEKVDVVFHLAARVSIRASTRQFREDARTNVMGTLSVLDQAARAGIGKLVFASSMAIYGEAERSPQDEDHPTRPLSPYGISKLAGEQYCRLIARLSGFDAVALRYFNTYGTRQTLTPYVGVITIFVHRLLAGQAPVIFGDGEQARDFVHVEDVARVTVRAMESDIRDSTINVGTGRGTTVKELTELLAERMAPGTVPEYRSAPEGETRLSIAGVRKLRQQLGLVPESRLEDKLDEVISFIRNHGSGRNL